MKYDVFNVMMTSVFSLFRSFYDFYVNVVFRSSSMKGDIQLTMGKSCSIEINPDLVKSLP